MQGQAKNAENMSQAGFNSRSGGWQNVVEDVLSSFRVTLPQSAPCSLARLAAAAAAAADAVPEQYAYSY